MSLFAATVHANELEELTSADEARKIARYSADGGELVVLPVTRPGEAPGLVPLSAWNNTPIAKFAAPITLERYASSAYNAGYASERMRKHQSGRDMAFHLQRLLLRGGGQKLTIED